MALSLKLMVALLCFDRSEFTLWCTGQYTPFVIWRWTTEENPPTANVSHQYTRYMHGEFISYNRILTLQDSVDGSEHENSVKGTTLHC